MGSKSSHCTAITTCSYTELATPTSTSSSPTGESCVSAVTKAKILTYNLPVHLESVNYQCPKRGYTYSARQNAQWHQDTSGHLTSILQVREKVNSQVNQEASRKGKVEGVNQISCDSNGNIDMWAEINQQDTHWVHFNDCREAGEFMWCHKHSRATCWDSCNRTIDDPANSNPRARSSETIAPTLAHLEVTLESLHKSFNDFRLDVSTHLTQIKNINSLWRSTINTWRSTTGG